MPSLPVLEMRKVWTREEAHALVDLGFPNAEKLELIDGDLIDHMGKKHAHNYWQNLIRIWLEKQFGAEYVQVEPSIYVSADDNLRSEPEPDLIVTAQSIRAYQDNATPPEIRLLIEVADSSLPLDLGVKALLYARAAIVEYWVIAIPDRLLHVHRNPAAGVFASIIQYGFDAQIAPLAKPDAPFCLNRL